MPFMTIAGVTYQVLTDSNPQESFEPIRSMNRAWDGKLFVEESAAPRTWGPFPLAPLTQAQYATLITNTLGLFVACSGEFSNNVAVQCLVEVVAGYFKAGTNPVPYRMPSVTLTETL
jgi:hypothetical protein